jgi:integrase
VTPGDAADRYLAHIGRQGRSARTMHRYRTYLYLLADMFPHMDVDELTEAQWMKWVDRICTRSGGGTLDVDTVSQRMSIAKTFSHYLFRQKLIAVDLLDELEVPRRKNPVENDSIVWVSPEETRRMIAVAARDLNLYTDPADRYRKILCLGVLAYTGSRRRAVANARIGDVDLLAEPPTITFHEKGGKRIKKPLNPNLADLIREAALAGVWALDESKPNPYLIPPRGTTTAKERDGKVVWQLVKEVARDAGVKAHVHALRAAFAVLFLEQKPDQVVALKDYLGHSSLETTLLYVRRRNRQKGMEAVAEIDWGQGLTGTTFEGNPVTEKEGFEPSFSPKETEKTE